MKKVIIYLLIVIFSASIPVYALLIWQPLKDKSVMREKNISTIVSSEKNENLRSIDKLKEDKIDSEINIFKINVKEIAIGIKDSELGKLDRIVNKLSTIDIVKVNSYFSITNKEYSIRNGIELIKRRMPKSDYDEVKKILNNYINFNEIENEI